MKRFSKLNVVFENIYIIKQKVTRITKKTNNNKMTFQFPKATDKTCHIKKQCLKVKFTKFNKNIKFIILFNHS